MRKLLALTLAIAAAACTAVYSTASHAAPYVAPADASVTTDKTDYQPGETVVISGSGFAAGETVQITLKEDPARHPDTQLNASADEYGNFVNKDFSPTEEHRGVGFALSAVGQSSGRGAAATFTDGGSFNYSPNNQTLNIQSDASPQSASFSQVVSAPRGNGTFTAALQVVGTGTTPLPSAWVSASPNPLNYVTGSGTPTVFFPQTRTVTVTVPPLTPAGTYTAQVKINPSITGVGAGSGTNLSVVVTADNAAPNTTLSATTPPANPYNGVDWTNQDVTVTLSATDTGTPASGVASTQYKIDSGAYQTYASPFNITPQGLHTVTYFSTDLQGNVEGGQTFTVKIDKTKPVITLNGSPDVTVVYGSGPYADPGASASDAGGSGLAGPVASTGGVDTNVVGDYALNYDVSDNAGNAADTVTRTVHVVKAEQTIDFGPLAGKTYGDPDFNVSATAGSGDAVVFSAAGDCTVSGSTVHITGAGSCTITADEDGNANYNAAPSVQQSFNIAKANALVTVTPYSVVYDGNPHTAGGTATGVFGEDLSSLLDLSGTTHTNAGAYNGDAWSFAGDANYNPASGTADDAIAKAPSTTAVNCPSNVTYTGAALEPCTATVTGAGGLNQSLPVSYSNNVNAGSASAAASYPGDANHEASSGTGGFTIDKAPSVTDVTCSAGPFTYNGSPHTPCSVSVTGAGGLNLSPAPSYANNVNAGNATASYAYVGDANHNASGDSETFVINKADAVISVTGYTGFYDGSAHGATGTATGVLGENLTPLLNLGGSFTNVPGGTANWTFNSANTNTNYNSASGSVAIVIKAWTLSGFYQPVDMLGVVNTVKGGSTVPMKFEIFAGTTEKTSVADILSFQFQEITCGAASPFESPIEVTTTGGTSLRYDLTGGQFIQNWQTPKTAGKCYQVRMTARDGSKLDAFFKTK